MKTLPGKWLLRFLMPFCFALSISFFASAQCTLGPGDLVFTGYNQLDDGTNGAVVDDSFSFMLLKDVPAGQVIFFTDLGWTNSNAFQAQNIGRSDAIIKWTADVAYPAGTEIIITCKYNLTAKSISGAARGTVAVQQLSYNTAVLNFSPAEHMSLGEIQGDQIFAFINSPATPTFLAGISINRDPSGPIWDASLPATTVASERSILPAALATGAQNLGIKLPAPGDPSYPGAPAARYNKVTQITAGLPATLRTAINDASKWEIKSDGNPFDPPILTPQVYIVTGVSITTQPVDGLNICQGSSAVFSIVAANVCAYQWQESTDGGTNFNNITNGGVYSGATTATLTISNVSGFNNRKYRVILSGVNGLTSNAVTLTLVDPTIIFNATLPAAGTFNTAYSQTVGIASGGRAPFTFGLVTAGTLPPGLTLNSATGVISGTPTQAGTYNFDVRATDACATPNTATKSYSIVIAKADQTITLADITKNYGDPTFTLPLNTDAGLPVTYTSATPAVATITGNTVTIVGAGTSVITATQAGNTNYNAAVTVIKTLTVNKKAITVTADAKSKVYGQNDPTLTQSITLGGPLVTGDSFTGALTRDPGTDVGTYNITQGTLTAGNNYNITYVGALLTIVQKPVTISLQPLPQIIKTYDNTTTATIAASKFVVNGVVSPDVITVSYTANYSTKDAGIGKIVNVSNIALVGVKKDNYSLGITTATTSGIITPLAITLGLNATPLITKAYDNTTTATLAAGNYSLNGILGTDAVTVSGVANYDTKDVGTSKTITANTFVLAGAQKDNYSLTTTTATTTGNITALPITLSLNLAPTINKVYDNTTTATLAAGNYTLNGILGADAVSVSSTATYNNANAGLGKIITANAFVLTGAQKDNYNLTTTTATTSGNIFPRPITLALNATPLITKAYDNTTTATLAPANYTLTGILGTDAVTVSGTANYDNKAVATGKTITVNTFVLAGAQKDNYSLSTTTATTSGDITVKPITLALNATPLITKPYDGNNNATLAPANYTLTGVLGADAVSVSGTATYDNATAGTGKTVTATGFTLAGAQNGNYSLSTTTATTTGNITALPVTVALNATPLITKVYDNTTAATLAPANYTLTGILGADDVTISGTATYNTKDAGTGKTITANTFVLAGAQKDNYSLTTTTATTTGNVTALPITAALNATPLITKVYDNTTTATLAASNYTLNGILGADAVSVSATATYDTKDVGTGKTITANTFVLAGAQKDNYSLTTTTATTTGNITGKALTLALNATPLITKVYDNTTTATLAPANYTLTGVLGADAVSVSGTATYDTKDAGNGKTVTANTFVLAGAQKDNYSLTTTTATTTGNITALPVTLALNATPLITKVYDNTTTATLAPANYTINGILGTDAVSVSGTATYDTKDAGTGKTITANTFVLAGAQKDNYSLSTTTATTTGDITGKALTLALNAIPVITKVYDNTVAATLAPANYTLTGVLGTDAVSVSGTATYDNATAGTGKTITANTFVLAGAQKDNYSLTTTTATTTGNITALPVTMALNATPLITKVYDNTTTATLAPANYTINGILGTDAVTVSGTATYDTKDAGTGKTITANTFVLAGAQKDNYSLTTTTATTTGDITTKGITIALNAIPVITKVYDNTVAATLAPANYTLSGVLGTDAVSASGTATYDNASAGTGKTVTATSFVLTGAQKDNYNLANTTATTTGNITTKTLTATLNATPLITKVYDNTTTATLAPANITLNGINGTDVVTVSATATYDNRNAGTGKTITANTFVLAGAQKDNYTLTTTTATTTGNITGKAITLALNATPLITKVYDNTTTATLAPANYTLTGILGTDAVSVSGTASYDNKNAGTGKTITANTFVLAGAQKDNYSLTTTTATTTGNIQVLPVTLALNTTPLIAKIYDGNTTATLAAGNYNLSNILGTDDVSVSSTATYDNKNAGTGKTITATNLALTGAQKDNYSLTTTTATTTGAINTKALTVTADDKTKFQGTANPPLTIAYNGFITGEDVSALTTLPVASTTATTASPIGDYDINVTGGAAANYNLVYVKGTLKVLPGAPTDITLTTVPLFENRPAGTLAGTLSSTSNNPSATFTYSLVAGAGGADNAAFNIVGNQIVSAASFDFETKSSYSVLVRSTTQYGLSLDKQFTINISDVNEAPTLDPIANQTICYTTANQNVALTGISAGPESGQTVALTITSSNPNLFQALSVSNNGANGTISYRIRSGAIGTATVTVTVKDNGGTANNGTDTFTRTFVITVNPLPIVNITADKGLQLGPISLQISKGETVKLTATGGTIYSWTATNGSSIISGQNSSVLTIRPQATTTYTVTVTNASGCSETKTLTVIVLADYLTLKTTNILSPNGDGYNDKWVVDNIDFYPNNEVKIFDKSGRPVYTKRGYDNSWDGTLNGSPLSEGTYYFIIDFGNGTPTFRGFITLIREN